MDGWMDDKGEDSILVFTGRMNLKKILRAILEGCKPLNNGNFKIYDFPLYDLFGPHLIKAALKSVWLSFTEWTFLLQFVTDGGDLWYLLSWFWVGQLPFDEDQIYE